MKRPSLALFVIALFAIAILVIAVTPTTLLAQAQTQAQAQNQAPRPARSRSDEMLDRWNDIGNKLVAMAQDFPEDKYDYKLQKDERTFAQNLLHVAAVDYDLTRAASGSTVGPDFGKDKHNPIARRVQDQGRCGETDSAGRRRRR